MDVHATLDAPCSAAAMFASVEDLALYPQWMDLVHRAELELPRSENPAWQVELRARVGPLARSKRLRMERTKHDAVAHVAVFERVELDGRRHSPWVLRAQVSEADGRSTLGMHLHYGGGLWTGGVLERVLTDQIMKGRERLRALMSSN